MGEQKQVRLKFIAPVIEGRPDKSGRSLGDLVSCEFIIIPPQALGTGPDNATFIIGSIDDEHVREQDDPSFQKGWLRSTRNEPGIDMNPALQL